MNCIVGRRSSHSRSPFEGDMAKGLIALARTHQTFDTRDLRSTFQQRLTTTITIYNSDINNLNEEFVPYNSLSGIWIHVDQMEMILNFL